MADILKASVEHGVATLTLNRPAQRNALSPELSAALVDELWRTDADPAVKCIVIAGEGEHFCAGGDVKGFNEALSLTAEERHELFKRKLAAAGRLPNALLQVRKPVVAVIRGAVAGAGLTLCLAADYALASESAHFTVAHVHVGLSLDCGLSGLLVAAMGLKAAKRLSLLGERIDAREALSLGLVSEVVSAEQFAQIAQQRIRRFASGPSVAMATTKALLNEAALANFQELLAHEAEGVARCAATDDFCAGVTAVLQRKSPEFISKL